MRRAAALLVLLLAPASCGDRSPIPAEYLMIRFETPTPAITLGEGFPVTVRRIWSKDLRPSDFTDRDLEPLRVRLLDTTRRENDTHVEETRGYLAYAFTPGELTVSAPRLVGTPVLGGAKLAVAGNRFALDVKGTIDPETPGDAELPGEVIAPTRIWWRVLLGFLLVAAAALRARARRRAPPVEDAVPPPVSLPIEDGALAELERLRQTRPAGNIEVQKLYRECTGILRTYLGRRFSLDTGGRTTEELIALEPLHPHRARLREVLGHCDLVKFAKHAPTAGEREILFGSAEKLVRETSAS